MEKIDYVSKPHGNAYLCDKKVVTTDVVRHLHKRLGEGILYEAGNFRQLHLMRGGVIFVHPHDVAAFVEEWCVRTRDLMSRRGETPLLAAHLVSDFVGIHPFSDFNGKMSLLLIGGLLGERRILQLPSIIGKRTYYAAMYAAGRGDFSPLSSAFDQVLQPSNSANVHQTR
jgi:fido (protein-threonine AMPylation protein)